MVYGERTKKEMANEYATDSSRHKEYRDFLIRFHTIAIAYKTDEWDLINYETIDFLDLKNQFPGVIEFQKKSRGAILCLLKHKASGQTIVLGNTHFEHDPLKDHVKFAQAAYYIEHIARYILKNKGNEDTLPFITGGDFNSLPISSVLSAFYNENIESLEENN